MASSKYEVRDKITNTLFGTFEELDMVFAFIKGFKQQFFNEKLILVIIEIIEERECEENEN